MKTRLTIALLALGVALASSAGSAAGASTTGYELWFQRDGKLWLAMRVMPTSATPAKATITALLRGPNAAEANTGVTSPIRAGTSLVGIALHDGTATIELSREFGLSTSSRMRLAQITRTLTQFPSIRRVTIRVGQTTLATSTRASSDDLLPAILVRNPPIGSRLRGSVNVSGTADVFEAALTIRVLNAHGHSIATVHTLATCGTGCRGIYGADVPVTVRATQPGTILVFDDDADGDGHPSHLVRIPVVLTA
jgi:hypothetical protein